MKQILWKIKTSFKTKIILAFFLISAFSSCFLAVLFYQVLKSNLISDLNDKMSYVAQLASLSIDSGDLRKIQSLIKTTKDAKEIEEIQRSVHFQSLLRKLDDIKKTNHPVFMDAFVLISSGNDELDQMFLNFQLTSRITMGKNQDGIYFGDFSQRIALQQLREKLKKQKKEEGMVLLSSIHYPESEKNVNIWLGFSPIIEKKTGEMLGLLCLEIADSHIPKNLKKAWFFSILIAVCALVFSFLASVFLGNFFTRGIRSILMAIKQYFKKDYTARVLVNTADEIGQLGMILNRFAFQVEQTNHVLEEKNRVIRKQLLNSVQILSSFLASSSTRLYEVTQAVTKITILLAKKQGFSPEEIEKLEIASRLHDLGMIGGIERLLSSGKSLSQEEIFMVKNHPMRSVEIIKWLDQMDDVKKIISQHHERFNGEGYPFGLKSDEIVPGARIIGIVDDFVALLSKREFQEVNKKQKIVDYLQTQKGTLYEPVLVDSLVALIDEEHLIYIPNPNDIRLIKENDEINWQIPSNINFEPILVQKVMDELASLNIDPELLDSIDYSLGEVMRNAIIHGNKYAPDKKVTLSLKVEDQGTLKKISIRVRDEGEGMNIEDHNRFSKIRRELFDLLDDMKKFELVYSSPADLAFKGILSRFNQFKTAYFSDFNSFRQMDQGSELTGGVGLLYVKRTFDNVVFRHILYHDKITGTEILMEKYLENGGLFNEN